MYVFFRSRLDAIRVGSMLPMCPSSDIEPPRLSIIEFTNSVHIYRHPEKEKLSLFLNFEELFFVKPDLSATFAFSGVSLYFYLINVCF
jgi:hypothetical protein